MWVFSNYHSNKGLSVAFVIYLCLWLLIGNIRSQSDGAAINSYQKVSLQHLRLIKTSSEAQKPTETQNDKQNTIIDTKSEVSQSKNNDAPIITDTESGHRFDNEIVLFRYDGLHTYKYVYIDGNLSKVTPIE